MIDRMMLGCGGTLALYGSRLGAAVLFALAGASVMAPPVQAQAVSANTAPGTARPAAGGENAALGRRVIQIEEQLLDIQVMIGTLQSLARPGPRNSAGGRSFSGVSSAGGSGAGGSARLAGLETQIQALTAQIERMAAQLNTLQQRQKRAGNAGPTFQDRQFTSNQVSPLPQGLPLGPPGSAARPVAAAGPTIAGFGSTTVTTGVEGGGPNLDERTATRTLAEKRARGAGAGGNPRQRYDTAYGYLLQQNYGAAQTGFSEYVELYPNNPRAGDAQFWLGETYYVRGRYKEAANAFLLGYQTYGRSAKAPHSLLKLAMALDRLGQKEVACSSYAELGAKFPRAPADILQRAKAEQRRAGC